MRLAVVNASYPLSEDVDSIVFSFESGVLYTGRESGINRFQPLRVIDADQRIVIPGLTDAHMHLYSTALAQGRLDLRKVKSIDELKELVRKAYESSAKNEWIVGRGWDQDKMEEKRLPTRYDLDEVAPEKPVVLVRVCGHAAVLNTKAMDILGLKEKYDKMAKFIQIEDGKPTGVVLEDLVYYVLSKIPPPPMDKVVSLVKSLLEEYLSYGVVQLHSMSVTEDELEVIARLEDLGELIHEYNAYIEHSEFLRGVQKKYRGLIRGVKLFSDGSFGARTAALRQPYSDAGVSGELLLDAKAILELSSGVVRENLEVAVHAIGDKALEQVLEAAKHLKNTLRIEHASLTPLDLLEKISQLRPRISVQPHFILSDTWITDRLGDRTQWVYAFKSLLSSGARLMGSSDSPVEPFNPWLGVYAAVERGGPEGLPIYNYTSFEKLTFTESLRLYSENTSLGRSLVVTNLRNIPRSKQDYERARAEIVITRKGVKEVISKAQ
ncbi:MAG: amidohydrolase [Infirmifilum sp.]|jgi:predicted amidohydrolase YtcJ|uniref:amidohydrolase n=1 Tax=Infirmifilum TaxID=2856573 RepID=UPI002352943D